VAPTIKIIWHLVLFGRKISDAEDGDLALQRRVVGEFGELLGGAFGRREFGLSG
jgi:hypothetical protein